MRRDGIKLPTYNAVQSDSVPRHDVYLTTCAQWRGQLFSSNFQEEGRITWVSMKILRNCFVRYTFFMKSTLDIRNSLVKNICGGGGRNFSCKNARLEQSEFQFFSFTRQRPIYIFYCELVIWKRSAVEKHSLNNILVTYVFTHPRRGLAPLVCRRSFSNLSLNFRNPCIYIYI